MMISTFSTGSSTLSTSPWMIVMVEDRLLSATICLAYVGLTAIAISAASMP